jgi:hypothetical protein
MNKDKNLTKKELVELQYLAACPRPCLKIIAMSDNTILLGEDNSSSVIYSVERSVADGCCYLKKIWG